MIFTQPVVYEFKDLTMPVLLIIGQRDRTALGKANAPEKARSQLGNYPRLGKQTARLIPKSSLAELDKVGHLPHIEAYDRFRNALLKFVLQ
jgi:pimeloyl-ACP methyl ester carboxylesterase